MFAPPSVSREEHFAQAVRAARDAYRRARETRAEALAREYEELVGELRAMTVEGARRERRKTELVRAAGDREYWKLEGCSSLAQWLARITSTDFAGARRVTTTSEALRSLPALDEALATGVLTLDQVAAAAPFATPESDAEIARLAVGQAPSQIGRAARKLAPPRVEDDAALYEKRALHTSWVNGDRELLIHGRLPLEQGRAFEQAIWDTTTSRRACEARDGVVLEWQQSTADALVSLAEHRGASDTAGVQRSRTTLIVHLSPDAPAMLEGAGPISPETAERLGCDARRLVIKPSGSDLVHARVGRCASYAQLRALLHRSDHCQFPGCTASHALDAHHMIPRDHGGLTVLANLILLCHHHHKHLHDHHIQATGDAKHPVFTNDAGRPITTHQPHAPPG